jgi:hypothetical protein
MVDAAGHDGDGGLRAFPIDRYSYSAHGSGSPPDAEDGSADMRKTLGFDGELRVNYDETV